MVKYEAFIVIRPDELAWIFHESDMESAKDRLRDKVDEMIEKCVSFGVVEVPKEQPHDPAA